MTFRSLAIVMPAFNEAEGLPGFLHEILDAVRPLADQVHLVVVDDCSTDDTVAVLETQMQSMPELSVHRSAVNRSHGPTALAAYRAGLGFEPDALVHVDGDGQFVGADFPRVLRALEGDGVQVVHGVRTGRTDPWFRRALTACVGAGVALVAGGRIPDVNTPLRAYRPEALRALLERCPADAAVPHVHFSIAEAHKKFRRRYIRVRSIPRRGTSASGTMWGAVRKPTLPPRRLISFSLAAAREVWLYSVLPGGAGRARRTHAAGA